MLALGIMACASAPRIEMPAWITHPNMESSLGGCGSAGRHVNGPQAQQGFEELEKEIEKEFGPMR